MGVIAETVRIYLEIANLRHQQRLAGQIVEVFQQRKSLADSLYDRGLIDTRGLFTARRNLRNAQAELPQIEVLLADAEGRLWVLMGGYRAELADLLPDSLTPSVALNPVPAGIPADLLVQRPDVSAARQRVAAARYTQWMPAARICYLNYPCPVPSGCKVRKQESCSILSNGSEI